jgi:hypothetical protein
MTPQSIVHFEDLKDLPSIRVNLPSPLPIGTRVHFDLTLRRMHGGRTEEARIHGEFKVTSVSIEVLGSTKQIVSVASTGVSPTWKSIKSSPLRRLSPAPNRLSMKTVVL